MNGHYDDACDDYWSTTVEQAADAERRRSLDAGEWDPRAAYGRDGREITKDDYR